MAILKTMPKFRKHFGWSNHIVVVSVAGVPTFIGKHGRLYLYIVSTKIILTPDVRGDFDVLSVPCIVGDAQQCKTVIH